MGKGSRSRAIHAEEKLNNPEKFSKKPHKSAPKWVAPLVALVLVLAVVAGVAFSILNVNGVMRRAKTSVSSENFTVTGTMMSVYFNSTLQAYQNQAYQYAYYYSIIYGQSTGKTVSDWYQQLLGYNQYKDLDKQVKDEKTGSTWFDYFLSSTKSSVKSMLVHCEAAKAAGYELSDEDLATIDTQIESMKSEASENSMSLAKFISTTYGTGVKEKDFREAYKLQLLASKYREKVNDDLDHSITEDDINKYYDEHETDFSRVNYFSYTVKLENDEQKEAVKKMTEATTLEEFKAKFTEYYKLELGENDKTEEDLAKEIDDIFEDKKTSLTYADRDTDSDLQNWMFTGEWKGDKDKDPGEFKVGKTFTVDGESETKTVVYHILTAAEKDTYLTKQNISYLPIANFPETAKPATLKAFADTVLAQFEKGEHTADAMKELVENLNKSFTDETKKLEYKNIEEYSSSSKVSVTEVDDWITEAKVGDYKLIKNTKTTTEKDDAGKDKKVETDTYYLVLVNDGEESWHSGCHDEVLEKLEEDWYNEQESKYGVNFDDGFCNKYSNYN